MEHGYIDRTAPNHIMEGIMPGPARVRRLDEARRPIKLTRAILSHGADTGNWFQVPNDTEVILFTKNGQLLYTSQVVDIFEWIRETSRYLPNKSIESLDGNIYSVKSSPRDPGIKFKVSINSPNLIDRGIFEPIATNSDQTKALRGQPAMTLCPDVRLALERPQEVYEHYLDRSPWTERDGDVIYSLSGFQGIYMPESARGGDDPTGATIMVATAGLEKVSTQWFRNIIRTNPAGIKLSEFLPELRQAYINSGLLREGEIFRIFILCCSDNQAPPGLVRSRSREGNYRGVLGYTPSTGGPNAPPGVYGGKRTRKSKRTKSLKKYRNKRKISK